MYSILKLKQIKTGSILGVLFLLLIMVGTVFADPGRTTYYGWVGKTVIAQKDVTRSGNSWNGRLWSHTSDGTAIGAIGWTYWTHRELCGGIIGDNYPHLGYAPASSGVYDIGVDSYSPCSGIRYGRVLGNHEFKNIGYSDWHIDWVHTETLQ